MSSSSVTGMANVVVIMNNVVAIMNNVVAIMDLSGVVSLNLSCSICHFDITNAHSMPTRPLSAVSFLPGNLVAPQVN
jgi:hypothetical protein